MIAVACSSLIVALVLGRATRPPSRTPPGVGAAETRRRSRRRNVVIPALTLGAIALVLGALFALGIAVAIAAWPRLQRLLAARATRRAIEAALPDAIEMLILVVHAGMTPYQAVLVLESRAPLPTRSAFAEVRRRVDRGTPLAEALRALPDLLGPTASVVADTLAMAERYGTPIGHALEQLAADVRERRRRQAEADARKLPVRMSFPLVVCTLPSFVLIAIVPAVLAALGSLDTTGF